MNLCHHLSFKDVYSSEMILKEKKQLTENAQKLQEAHPELITETRNLHENLENIRKQICGELEDFVKDNNLRLEPEPTFPGYNPYG